MGAGPHAAPGGVERAATELGLLITERHFPINTELQML
jgi:hypothetical protein